jgi:hypothetical protein
MNEKYVFSQITLFKNSNSFVECYDIYKLKILAGFKRLSE